MPKADGNIPELLFVVADFSNSVNASACEFKSLNFLSLVLTFSKYSSPCLPIFTAPLPALYC